MVCACHICGGRLEKIALSNFSEWVTSDCRPWRRRSQLPLSHCKDCGTVQKPVSGEWRLAASEIYASYSVYAQSGGAEQVSFDMATGFAMARSQRVVSWLAKQRSIPKAGSLLDIGCGNGAFLRSFGGAYQGWGLTGLELDARNKDNVEKLPGVERFHVGPIEDLGSQFDLIVMIHALEHIPNPVEFLRELLKNLKAGGHLLIQVPNLSASPFDLLIADHCSHFSAVALQQVVTSAGYEVSAFVSDCVAKELTLLAAPLTVESQIEFSTFSAFNNDDARATEGHIEWLHQVMRQGREECAQVGVFGTSISGTWLASTLDDKVDFFVDEDPSRIGRTHMGKPVYSPRQAPCDVDVLMPMLPEFALAISTRIAKQSLRLVMPPAYTHPRD